MKAADLPYLADLLLESVDSARDLWAAEGESTGNFEGWAKQDEAYHTIEQATAGSMIFVDKRLTQMARETSPTVPEWTPSQVLPAPDGLLVWESPVADAVWMDEEEALPTTADAIAWATTGRGIDIILLTRLSGHRHRLSPLRRPSPLVTWATMTLSPDLAIGAGVNLRAAQGEKIRRAGQDALAAFGATLLLMSQPSIVEEAETMVERKPRNDKLVTRPLVRVQERRLTRRAYTGAGGSRGKSTSRWWVRGHWRQQAWGPKRSLRKPVFIEPHTAGAQDGEMDKRPRVEKWRP